MNSRNINAFVRASIKSRNGCLDQTRLKALLGQMSTDNLQDFWTHFTSNRAFSIATTAVPDWKAKQQESVFQSEVANFIFFPKDKDVNGKNIIVREELEEHIRKCLIKYINDEIQSNAVLKNRSLLQKTHSFFGLVVLVMVVPFAFCLIFSNNKIATTVSLVFALIWLVYLTFTLMVRYIEKRKYHNMKSRER